MAATQTVVEVVLERTKETKNTIVYENDEGAINRVYLEKPAAKEIGNPASIKLTVEPM
jgi:hypothetical protein